MKIPKAVLDNVIQAGIQKKTLTKEIEALKEQLELSNLVLKNVRNEYFQNADVGDYVEHNGYAVRLSKLYSSYYLQVNKIGTKID